jgi:NAD(P)-dependent dehydrogenase (short-subunit alcohol dehydrogenase family)
MTSLKDKIAIVTGAGGGLGSATAIVLAERGATVVVADLNMESAERTAAEIRSKGGVALPVRFNMMDEESIKALINTTVEKFGRIDILHNCAADCSPQSFPLDTDVEKMDVPTWDRAFSINVRGTMLCCKYALPHMPRHSGASIINTASNMGLQGNLMLTAYSSTKAAMMQLTRNIATTHGKQGIRCNTVSPGMILTKPNLENTPKQVRDAVEAETLTPTLGDPIDIANAVAFLASSDAKHITGQNLVVDGGLSVHAPGFAAMLAGMQH